MQTERPVAIVTGGGRGIGRAVAVDLAKVGMNVAVVYRSNEAAAAEAKTLVEAAGGQCLLVAADVAVAEDRQRLVETVRKQWGRCDLLVNNAGVAPLERKDLLEATEESFDRVLAVNLKGPYFLTQKVANWMIDQQKEHPGRVFRIINVGSISAYTSSPSRGEYCVSKAALGMNGTSWKASR